MVTWGKGIPCKFWFPRMSASIHLYVLYANKESYLDPKPLSHDFYSPVWIQFIVNESQVGGAVCDPGYHQTVGTRQERYWEPFQLGWGQKTVSLLGKKTKEDDLWMKFEPSDKWITNWAWKKTNMRNHENFYQDVKSKLDTFEKKLNSFLNLKKRWNEFYVL